MPGLEIDDVDFIAEAAFQMQHETVAADIGGNDASTRRERELRRRGIAARRSMAAQTRRKSHHQHAKRDYDQDAEQDDGRNQERIGWPSLHGSGQRRHAGFGV